MPYTVKFGTGQSVEFQNEPTPQDIEEVSRSFTVPKKQTLSELQTGAQEAETVAQQQASPLGMAKNFGKSLVKETAKTLLQAPARFAGSAIAAPSDLYGQAKALATNTPAPQPYSKEMPFGLGKTFQSEAIQTNKGLADETTPATVGTYASALKPFVEVPLAGATLGGYTKGLIGDVGLTGGAKLAPGEVSKGLIPKVREARFAKSQDKFFTDLVQPTQTTGQKGAFTKNIKSGNVKEGGFLKGRTVEPDPFQQRIIEAVKTVPGVKKSNTLLQNTNAIHDEIGSVASDLRLALKTQRVNPIVDADDINGLIGQTKAQLAENPLLVGDAEKTGAKILDKFVSLLPKNRDITAIDILDARQGLDNWMQSIKGETVFNPATENAVSISLRAVRQGANTLIDAKAPDVAVKEFLKRQSLLYNAIENIAPKAAKEAGTGLLRWFATRPILQKVLTGAAWGSGAILAGKALGGDVRDLLK